jgi:outer membrane protein OmpA-like peptidoglycan-associated protein
MAVDASASPRDSWRPVWEIIRMRRRAFLPVLGLAALGTGCAERAELIAQPVHVVFFEGESVAIGDAALMVLRDAADVAKRYPNQPVRVLGFADPEGAALANRALSGARAQAVAAILARFGVDEARIRTSARGATAFVDTPSESRRVEVRIGPQ